MKRNSTVSKPDLTRAQLVQLRTYADMAPMKRWYNGRKSWANHDVIIAWLDRKIEESKK